jgi:prolyl oligopeptidase
LFSRRWILGSLSPAPLLLQRICAAPLRAVARPFSEVVQGIRIQDPYHWLEDDTSASRAFMAEEARYARGLLDRLPDRASFLERITKLTAGDMPGDKVQVANSRIFTFRRNAGSESMNLLVRDAPAARDRVLVDATKLGAAGANAGIDYLWNVSPDGRFVVFAYFENGSEELTIRVVNVDDGALLQDALSHVDMTDRSWAPDSSGFFYNRMAPGEGADKYNNNEVWFHRLRTPAAEDVLVLKAGMPGVEAPASDAPLVYAVPGSDYALGMFIRVGELIDSLYIAPLSHVLAGKAAWRPFATPDDGVLSATLWRDQVYAVVTRGAPRGRLVRTPAANANLATAPTVLPEAADFMIAVSTACTWKPATSD